MPGAAAGEGEVRDLVVLVAGLACSAAEMVVHRGDKLVRSLGDLPLVEHDAEAGAWLVAEQVGRDVVGAQCEHSVERPPPRVERLAGESVYQVERQIAHAAVTQGRDGPEGVCRRVASPDELQLPVVERLHAHADAVYRGIPDNPRHPFGRHVLGGNLKVEGSNYADLKAERYTQTREDSVTYTGTICTVEDFLGICRDGGATAVLHLKAFPKGTHEGHLDALAALIARVTDPAKVLMLTSSPDYIEYLRANHPELPLMFQAEKTWPERIEWCKERGLDIDLEKKLLTPECVKAYHDAGLKIAVWTVNDPAEAESLPVDYIITDLLVP